MDYRKKTNLKVLIALLCVNLIIYAGPIIADTVVHPQNLISAIIDTLTVTNTLTVTSGVTASDLTASRIVLSDANKKLASNGALTSNVVPKAASSGASMVDSTITDSGSTVAFSLPVKYGRMLATGFTPSCTSTNTTSAAISTGSTDYVGSCTLVGNGSNSNGQVTLTFSVASAYGTGIVRCVTSLAVGSGANPGGWVAGATVRQSTDITTAVVLPWLNPATNLASNSSFDVNYICVGT